MSNLRLVIRTHRFEATVFAIFSAVALVAAGALVLRLRSFAIPLACFTGGFDSGACGPYLESVIEYDTWSRWAPIALAGLVGMCVIPSLLLGLAVAAKELDRGTTAFVWSLTTSRRRWFLERVGPAAVAVTIAGLVAGLFADQLEAVRAPTLDAARSFELFGFRGLALAGLSLCVFGVTVVGGAIVGRLLPGLIVAAVLGIASVVVVNLVSSHFLESEAVLVKQSIVYGGYPGVATVPMPEPRVVDQRLLTPNGEVLSYTEATERYGGVWEVDDLGSLPPGEELPPGAVPMQGVLLVNPGEIYAVAEARMGLLYAVVGLLAIVVAFAVVERRRP